MEFINHIGQKIPQISSVEKRARTKLIITIEEHASISGLGDSVAQVLATKVRASSSLIKLSVGKQYVDIIGSQNFTCEQVGLTPILFR